MWNSDTTRTISLIDIRADYLVVVCLFFAPDHYIPASIPQFSSSGLSIIAIRSDVGWSPFLNATIDNPIL